MPLAGRCGKHQVVRRHRAPVSLLQILASVFGLGMVPRMVFARKRPMVASPNDVETGHDGALGETASPRKQVNRFHGASPSSTIVSDNPSISKALSRVRVRLPRY